MSTTYNFNPEAVYDNTMNDSMNTPNPENSNIQAVNEEREEYEDKRKYEEDYNPYYEDEEDKEDEEMDESFYSVDRNYVSLSINKIKRELDTLSKRFWSSSKTMKEDYQSSIRVALSKISDGDEVVIYDTCGRFIPIHKMDINDIICQLELYRDFIKIRDEVIGFVDPLNLNNFKI